jgi:hypothetical protein
VRVLQAVFGDVAIAIADIETHDAGDTPMTGSRCGATRQICRSLIAGASHLSAPGHFNDLKTGLRFRRTPGGFQVAVSPERE